MPVDQAVFPDRLQDVGPQDPAADAIAYDAGQMSQELFDDAMAPAVDPMDASEPEQMQPDTAMMMDEAFDLSLEHMVEGPEPPMPPPEEMYEDPYAQAQFMFDQQMQMLMNPFQMPGPMM